jgi:glycosidase
MLALTRALTALRRTHPALAQGSYAAVHCDDAVLAFRRYSGSSEVLVALNFTGREVPMPAALQAAPGVLLSTRLDRVAGSTVDVVLRADEGIVAG